jgi:lipoprotein-anchoring transpeptidase ErfK/SrfK
MFALPKRFAGLLFSLAFVAVLAGCTTGSSTYSAAIPTIKTQIAAQSEAETTATELTPDVRDVEKRIKALEAKIARDEKRVARKKISEKNRAKAATRLADNQIALKDAQRDLKKAERAEARADRALQRAERRLESAKARKVAAEERARRNDPARKFIADYAARTDNDFPVDAIPLEKVDKRLYRQVVKYDTDERPGTVVVDTGQKYLYLVMPMGRAMRYGIGVGREGFAWSGSATIGFKRVWPKWTPPAEMIARQPHLAKYCADCGGMAGGPDNPLGARALYLVQNGQDTLYRLHGTPDWQSIGTAASSGCIRLINQDVIDLYNRVRPGAKVVVI